MKNLMVLLCSVALLCGSVASAWAHCGSCAGDKDHKNADHKEY